MGQQTAQATVKRPIVAVHIYLHPNAELSVSHKIEVNNHFQCIIKIVLNPFSYWSTEECPQATI